MNPPYLQIADSRNERRSLGEAPTNLATSSSPLLLLCKAEQRLCSERVRFDCGWAL